MSRHCFRGSRPDSWNVPRPQQDPVRRRIIHGPILPMEEPKGWFRRLFDWH
ncbi:MAG TPA: hypothetical protein VLA37_05550 [Sphingomonadaceae bacterium]|nr:hypothetical protein [Sphingomonadaceae bacterium]